MHASAERFSIGDWRVLFWDEGAAAYHVRRGDTHALDPLTAEVLRLGGGVQELDDRLLAQRIALELDIPLDEDLQAAVAQSLTRLCKLARE